MQPTASRCTAPLLMINTHSLHTNSLPSAVADLFLVRPMRIFIIALGFGLVVCSTFGQAPTPPPAVPAGNWIAISPTVGFVITQQAPRTVTVTDPKTGKQTVERIPPPSSTLTGYFMVLRDGYWLRLQTEPPPADVTPL
jgi:hypothetical protein